jgi:hypothetical protein
MVSRSYRKTRGGDESSSGSRMLMVGPQRAGGDVYIPPPSVPGQ